MTEEGTSSAREPLGWVPGFVALVALFISAAALRLPIAHDEAYYWTWSQALSWSYFDHPPGIAVAIAASRRVLGEGQVALRGLAAAATCVTATFAWLAAREGAPAGERRRAGRVALLLFSGALMFTVGYLPATPDPLQGAALAATAWACGRAARGQGWAISLAFVLFAVSVLVKHSSALVALGALLAAVSHPKGRRLLLRRGVWVGSLLGLAVVLPWLLADLGGNDGATSFQATRVFLRRPSRGFMAFPLTLGALALVVGPSAAWGLLTAWRSTLRRELAVRVWAGGAAGLLGGCLVAAWFGAGEVNWLMPALAFGAPAVVAVERGLSAGGRKVFVRVTVVSAMVGLVVLAHIVYPFAPIAPRKDRTLRASGYETVANVVEEMASQYGAQVVVTRSYQAASQLRFHLEDRRPVLETASKRGSQYDRWERPSVCTGDVVILAWNRRDLPPGLEGTRVGRLRTVSRAREGRAVGRVFVQALRVDASNLCRRATR